MRVRVADGARVMGDDVGDLLGPDGHLHHLAQLVLALLLLDPMDRETAFDIVEQTEGLAGLLDGDYV